MLGVGLPLPIYLAPFLIAWYRQRRGKPIVLNLPQIFLLNFFLGWTVVGWLLALCAAFNQNPVAWVVLRIAKFFPAGGLSAMPPQPFSSSPQMAAVCSLCQGSGTMMCSYCGGRGSWYDAPTTATGVAQLSTCGSCVSSGRLRCGSCGGSGRIVI